MDLLDINEIEKRINQLAKRIDSPTDLIPTFGYSRDFGYPHVEVDGDGYHLIVVERGIERERKTTNNASELLYWIFENITSSMAWDYERENRIETQDSRVLGFKKQLELISVIDQDFEKRLANEMDQILKKAPFVAPPKFL